MLEFLSGHSETDAVVIIENDHKKVKALFKDFEDATTVKQKKQIADEAIKELKIHAAIEEDIFYAAVRGKVGNKLMNEADEEHHVAKLLIAELEVMDGTEDHYDAKFKVLAENIRHHIREEEAQMLPKARDAQLDFETLGMALMNEKMKLEKTGVPIFIEERVMAKSHGKSDSPAENSRKKKPVAKRAISKARSSKAKRATPAHAVAKRVTALRKMAKRAVATSVKTVRSANAKRAKSKK